VPLLPDEMGGGEEAGSSSASLRQEVAVLSRLQHPNIIRLVQLGASSSWRQLHRCALSHDLDDTSHAITWNFDDIVASYAPHHARCRFIGACLVPPHMCIVEELAAGGSLHHRIHGSRRGGGRGRRARSGCLPLEETLMVGGGSC
jgi:hypothetical protein